MLNGIIIIDKEPGFTSHDVVAKLRGICKQKKIGHTGTLDPDATGVLPVCLGKGTKVSGILTDSDKEYEAVLHLGLTTDTQDESGQVLIEKEVTVSEDDVRTVVEQFVGEILQIPPMYSALKVNGQKLCDLAREGIEVERKPRKISIYAIEIEQIELPYVTMRVKCSKGTYIRTLCNDIGEKLGCGGCMKRLRRTKAAGFQEQEAIKLHEVQKMADEGKLAELIKPIDSVFECYSMLKIEETFLPLAYNGNCLPVNAVKKDSFMNLENGQKVRIYGRENEFIGLFYYDNTTESIRPYKMFLA